MEKHRHWSPGATHYTVNSYGDISLFYKKMNRQWYHSGLSRDGRWHRSLEMVNRRGRARLIKIEETMAEKFLKVF